MYYLILGMDVSCSCICISFFRNKRTYWVDLWITVLFTIANEHSGHRLRPTASCLKPVNEDGSSRYSNCHRCTGGGEGG